MPNQVMHSLFSHADDVIAVETRGSGQWTMFCSSRVTNNNHPSDAEHYQPTQRLSEHISGFHVNQLSLGQHAHVEHGLVTTQSFFFASVAPPLIEPHLDRDRTRAAAPLIAPDT